MSKPSRRPGREEQKAQYRAQKRVLRQRQREQGLVPPVRPSASNSKSEHETVEEEQVARETAVVEQVLVMRTLLPVLLSSLSDIEDPRQAKKVRHQLAALLLYGILMFVNRYPLQCTAPSPGGPSGERPCTNRRYGTGSVATAC